MDAKSLSRQPQLANFSYDEGVRWSDGADSVAELGVAPATGEAAPARVSRLSMRRARSSNQVLARLAQLETLR